MPLQPVSGTGVLTLATARCSLCGLLTLGVALEASALIPVSDTFSLTPAVFWLSRPRGAMGGTTSLGEVLQPSRGEAVICSTRC